MFSDSDPDLQSLQDIFTAARIGWWKADLNAGTAYLSENLAARLGTAQRLPPRRMARPRAPPTSPRRCARSSWP